ncbi:16S rRNA (uracil(1498)-N(3))-methyltransferase [Aestuariivirga sp.]|uniref:16S rRNA (uracil(1498)-N(3))-methyltransferase n=1 Tax=Aestuariivirga sp. TaxID=2650926 RepID=UPI0039E57C9A
MKTTPRIHVAGALSEQREIALPREQAHYLTGVLRLAGGDPVRVFNGGDGEWLAYLATVGKKEVSLRCERRVADAVAPPDIDYIFAPLKHARLDYVVQKAVELGARRLRPIITHRTVAERVNMERMRANVIEAAEQCNLVFVPEVLEPQKLAAVLAGWESGRRLIYCDETAAIANPVTALKEARTPAAVLIGPEGGFTAEEKQALTRLPFVTAISLGPRIMRADTAAVAALALVQAVLGDWT